MNKLKDYNKWMKDESVPNDKDYTVVIPKGDLNDFNTLWLSSNKNTNTKTSARAPLKEVEVNGLRAVIAPSGETITSMAQMMKMDLSDFIRWNEVSVDSRVTQGQTYYLQKKIKTSNQSTHTVKPGESLWVISQAYGIRLKSLKRLNRDLSADMLRQGTIVYLANLHGKYRSSTTPLIELDHNSPFEWGITGKSENDYIIGEFLPDKPTKTNESQLEFFAKASDQRSHIVEAGETLYSIASKYGITVDTLQS